MSRLREVAAMIKEVNSSINYEIQNIIGLTKFEHLIQESELLTRYLKELETLTKELIEDKTNV